MKPLTHEPSGGWSGHRRAKGGRRGLVGAVVVVTGESSGSGRASALAFAAHGAKVVLRGQGREGFAGRGIGVAWRRGGGSGVPTDVGDPDAIERLAVQACDRFGRIDVWVEAASVVIAAPSGGSIGADNIAYEWLRHSAHHDVCDIPGADVVLTGQNYESQDVTSKLRDKVRTGAFVPFGTETYAGRSDRSRRSAPPASCVATPTAPTWSCWPADSGTLSASNTTRTAD